MDKEKSDGEKLSTLYEQLQEKYVETEKTYFTMKKTLKENSSRDASNELSLADNHPGDMGTDLMDRTKDFSLLEHYSAQLERIKHAIERHKIGLYGICEVCHREIPIERLEILPEATTCVAHGKHTPAKTHLYDRPQEEHVLLESSTERYSMNHGPDQEDAFLLAMQSGSSDSPQDLGGMVDIYHDSLTNPLSGAVEEMDGFVTSSKIDIPTKSFVRGDLYKQYLRDLKNHRDEMVSKREMD